MHIFLKIFISKVYSQVHILRIPPDAVAEAREILKYRLDRVDEIEMYQL